jgi:hypothetical protein
MFWRPKNIKKIFRTGAPKAFFDTSIANIDRIFKLVQTVEKKKMMPQLEFQK